MRKLPSKKGVFGATWCDRKKKSLHIGEYIKQNWLITEDYAQTPLQKGCIWGNMTWQKFWKVSDLVHISSHYVMTFCGNTMSQKFSTVSGLFVFPIPRHYIFILKKQISQSIKKQKSGCPAWRWWWLFLSCTPLSAHIRKVRHMVNFFFCYLG